MSAKAKGLLAVGAVAVVGAAGLWLSVGQSEASDQEPVVTRSLDVAEVLQTDLTRTESFDGTLGYEQAGTVFAQVPGTVTEVAEPGSVVTSGGVLIRIDNEPTVLMAGTIPAYRDLSIDSQDGPDIEQLEFNLVALGYAEGLTVDQDFTSATAAAVADWQESMGIEPDGKVDLGAVAFGSSTVRIDDRLVEVGDGVQQGAELLALSTETRIVTLPLESGDADVAAAGDPVSIDVPGIGTVEGTVYRVEAQAPAESAGNATDAAVPVSEGGVDGFIVINDQAEVAGLDEATVTVVVTTERREAVLAVPVTALVALAEGGYAIELPATSNDGLTSLVPVEVGLIAGEQVEITGAVEAGQEILVAV